MQCRARVIGLAAGVIALAGCYTLQPVGGTIPPVGTRVAFDVTDAGRLALGGSMGPEIGRIEGTLVERENGELVLAVSSVRMLRGGEQTWGGERIRIRSEHVGTAYERRLSKSRTFALVAVGVGAVAVFVAQSVTGGGSEDEPPLPDTVQTQVIPRP